LFVECDQNLQIELLDTLGRMVLTSDKKMIDVSRIQSGSYFVVMKDNAQRTLSIEKVIVE